MYSYYTAIIILIWYALGILCLLIWENDRLPRADKRMLCLTYALIALSSLAEWLGVQFNGNPNYPLWALKAAKCADYILTPMAGGALILQLRPKIRLRNLMIGLLAFNTLLQLVSSFTDWMITVDASHHYSHGAVYFLYMVLCLVIVGIVVISFILYGQNFRRQNRKSLFAISGLIIIGIVMQEALPGYYRTSYLALTLAAAMIFIHYNEFSSLTLDEKVAVQKVQIDTDALTGLHSRYAYSHALSAYDTGALPDDLVVFIIDINGLKQVNDSMGHDAGDELIIGASTCIRDVMSQVDRCYRTGGDEFVIFANLSKDDAAELKQKLSREAASWHGKTVQSLSLSIGHALAADHPGFSAEQLVREADMAMYAAKAEYYNKEGQNRRQYRR